MSNWIAGAVRTIPGGPAIIFGLAVWFGLVAILASELLSNHVELTKGEVAPYSMKAPREVEFQSNIGTQAVRRGAADAIEPVFRFDASIAESSETELHDALDLLGNLRGFDDVNAMRAYLGVAELGLADQSRGAPRDPGVLAGLLADDTMAYIWLSQDMGDLLTLALLVSQIPGIGVSQYEAAELLLLTENRWQRVRRESLRVTQHAMHNRITEAQVEEAHHAAMLDVSTDLSDLQTSLVRRLSKGFVRPNYLIDEQATEQARLAASESMEPVAVTVEAGETIVRQGELIRPEHLEKLLAVGLIDRRVDMGGLRARAALLLVMVAILVGYLASDRERLSRRAGPLAVLGYILLITVGVAKAVPIESDLKPVVFPIAGATMLVSVLLGPRLAVVTGVIAAFAIGIIESNSFQMAPQLFITGSVGALVARRLNDAYYRSFFVSAVGLSALATGLVFGSWGGSMEMAVALNIVVAALINGILSTIIVVKFAPALGRMIGIATTGQTSVTLGTGSRREEMPELILQDAGQTVPAPSRATAAGTSGHATTIAHEQAAMVSRTSLGSKPEAKPNVRERDAGQASPAAARTTVAGTQGKSTTIAREQASLESPNVPSEESGAIPHAKKRDPDQDMSTVPTHAPSTMPTAVDLDPEFENVSPEYANALLTIVVATLVAHADGAVSTIEQERLEMRIDKLTNLSANEWGRLHANLKWMIAVPPDLGLIARRCEGLNSEQKRLLGRSAIAVAGVDGRINPPEVVAVRKLYRAMSLSDGVFYDDLRQLLTGPATAPAAISPPRQHDRGRPVHEPLHSARPTGSAVVLDPKRLAETKADTQQVAIILGQIFPTDDAEERIDSSDSASAKYEGLDRSYEALVDQLLTRSPWSRGDFTELAGRFGLMADGAVEEVNEWAYKRFGEALVEEDMDRLVVNLEIIEEDAG